MGGITRYEKFVLCLTALFVLMAAGWFLASGPDDEPYTVTVQRQDPEPAVSAPEAGSWPESLVEGERIDLNTAGVYDLCRLPGIGEKRAQAIAAWREEHGPFQTVDELVQVPGIGPGILEGLREYAVTGGE